MAPKILVVDDEPDLEHLIKQKFRKEIKEKKYEFSFAGNGIQALEQLKNDNGIELVLTDINMPEMDGLTLLSEMRKIENPLLRSVIVSAYGDLANIRTAMNRGAFDFVVKPIDLSDLEITVKKALSDLKTLKDAFRSRDKLISIQKELFIAGRIQSSILPKKYPAFPERNDFSIFASMTPAKEVGGDFYDYFLIDQNRVGFVIGDVSGKGIPAAMLMAVTKTLLKTTALTGISTEECLKKINDAVIEDAPSKMFVTITYGILDLRNGQLEYTCAGHHPPYIISKSGDVTHLKYTNGILLGWRTNAEYKSVQYTLAPGDTIFLFTDGVTEAMDIDENMYEEERLQNTLKQKYDPDITKLTKNVIDDVNSYSSGTPQSDDITCVSIKYHP